jgi:hypothetical protein
MGSRGKYGRSDLIRYAGFSGLNAITSGRTGEMGDVMASEGLRLPRAVALGTATAAGAVGLAGLVAMPTANATCASFFGLGKSADCTSSLTSIAIAVGPNAQAHADGALGVAISWGDDVSSATGGLWNFALTRGTNSSTYAGGILSAGFAWAANNATASAGTGSMSNNNWWNAAVVIGARTDEVTNVTVNGVGNLGVGFLSSGDVEAQGMGTVTVNSLGPDNLLINNGVFSNASSFLSGGTTINNSGNLSWAWDIVGANNNLMTTGKFSMAGAFSQQGETVVQDGPGVEIKYRGAVGSPARDKVQKAAGVRRAGIGASGSGAGSGEGGKRAIGSSANARDRV